MSRWRQRTCERSIPHPLRDLASVACVTASLESLVERESVENDSVVKRTHETVDLKPQNPTMTSRTGKHDVITVDRAPPLDRN